MIKLFLKLFAKKKKEKPIRGIPIYNGRYWRIYNYKS